MDTLNIGINGFGRIGRTLFRLLHNHPNIRVTHINDLADAATLAHLLKYDSIHGMLAEPVASGEGILGIGKANTPLTQFNNPGEIPWDASNVDLVVECTGKFKGKGDLESHLKPGVKKVLLSAPSETADVPMVVMGINEDSLQFETKLFSTASCTTHNAAPMLQLLDELCGIDQAYITTVHSYTSDQSLHDRPHRDLRRARAAGQSIVPTTTGAAKALTRIFPHLATAIGGCGIRVPVPNGSLTDITANVRKPVSVQEINAKFKAAAQDSMHGIVFYTEDPIVSVDINNSYYSCTFDSQMTSVIGNMVKIIGWYDNEMGYSSRIVDTLEHILAKQLI
ncbi:glyceraldehyde 3-phosphate dehydrogenase [Robiginitalea myxolifaciens]|uniref:Glyceraldehyde 3-phosphate dehydrogenase n=1 Tax=Robiginitalea myxolifaciens TaxID=400055 RepID=A0A1I6FPK1_9FLAO|nr:type I glyceraldehyde-3-phosphate dehydrogenase [Robiginitalea myxolifaciens]SFR31869.1 glyceraldehyde 3-phosphate dehydrogenase [Robiginitalea myxolifaciens]